MPEMYMDVDVALAEVPVNIMPLVDDTDFKTREVAITYDQAGMDLVWNFTTTAGAMSQTAVTPTTAGDYDWTHQGDGMYTIEIPASGGASINNDAEGFGWFSGICTGVLPWRSPVIGFRAAGLNNVLLDSAYSTTRGLSGTALPAAAADAAGGIPISDAGGLDMDTKLANTNEITVARMGALTDWIDGGRLDLLLDAIPTTAMRGTDNAALASVCTETRLSELDAGNLPTNIADLPTVSEFNARSLPAADYVVTTDTIAGVTTVTNLTNAPTAGDLTAAMKTSVNTEADTALADIHLDHLLAVDYDPASKPGTATALLNELVESDGGVSRYTENALEQAPSGTGGDATEAKQNIIITHLTEVKGDTFAEGTDSLEAIRDRGDSAWTTGAGGSDRFLMVDTTIATLATQTSFTLAGGSTDDNAYRNCTVVIEDASTAAQKAIGLCSAYTGATKTVTLKYDPAVFTMAPTDKVYILAENALKSTDANRQLDVTTTGATGIDWGNVENKTTANDLSATDIQLCDTTTTNTDIADVPTTAEFELRTLLSEEYATAAKLDNLSSGTAATNKVASSATITTGTETNTYTSTANKDGVVHSVAPVGGTTDFYYVFELGANGVPVSVQWEGYVNSQGDDYTLYAWNFGNSAWDEVESISGSSGSAIIPLTSDLTVAHVGTGAEAGEVRFRIYSTDGTNVSTDRVLCSFATIYQSVGYVDGAIWIDTNGSNTGTIDFIDGVADNSVSTVLAATTIATSLGLKSFHIANSSDIVLPAAFTNFMGYGEGWNLDLNGRTINGSTIIGANVTGIAVAGANPSTFKDCYFGAATLPPGTFINCGIGADSGTFTGASGGEYVFIDCFSLVPGSGSPAFNFSGLGAATGINNRGWKGGANYTLDSDCTLSHEVLAGGGQTFTTGGADVELRGIFREATFVLSGAGTVQIVGVTGDITLSGTATSTVNIFGVSAALNDTSVNTTVTDDSVSSTDVGSILVDTAEIGTAGAGLTNINLPNQTMNITGNLSGSVGSLTGHTNQTADHTAGIADIPTVAEFNARTIPSADYIIASDTIAGVTTVGTCITNTDLVTAASIKTTLESAGSDLDIIVKAVVNKLVITEATGNSEMFSDASNSLGTISVAFSSDGTYTTRKRMVV